MNRDKLIEMGELIENEMSSHELLPCQKQTGRYMAYYVIEYIIKNYNLTKKDK